MHAFTNAAGAAVPFGSVVADGAWPYGSTTWTSYAGSGIGTGRGVIFAVRPNGTAFRVVKTFSCTTDGGNLFHGFSVTDGIIIGVARNGGQSNGGTLFQVATKGSSFLVLHHFSGTSSDGSYR